MLLINLLLATIMVIASVIVHYVGLHILSKWGRRRTERDGLNPPLSRQGFTVVTIVLGIFLLHSIEIWFYAALYLALDQFDTLETALYFSTSTFTTVGFGDIVLDERWRLLAATESMNGFLLIGWSTAYLISVITVIQDIDRQIDALRQRILDRNQNS